MWAVILSVGVDLAEGWEAGMGLVSGRTGPFRPFPGCGDNFEQLMARGNTVLSKFSLFPLFCGLQTWLW